jgi:hypothetical protein
MRFVPQHILWVAAGGKPPDPSDQADRSDPSDRRQQ